MPRPTSRPVPGPRSLLAVAALVPVLAAGAVVAPAQARPPQEQDRGFTFAVIGDVPYGDAAQVRFPAFVDLIDADPDVRTVVHLGDIKSGSTRCDTSRLLAVRDGFERFDDPLVYTPGDNEWTDCHRANNGGYQPLERLGVLRDLFFSPAGIPLGGTDPDQPALTTQADRGVPENVRWTRGDVSFATLHVVGSNDDLLPWSGLGLAAPTAEQVEEQRARMDAALAQVRAAFAEARTRQRSAVVLLQQADLFDPTVVDPDPAAYSAFRPLVRTLAEESRRFRGPVYLLNGDSHRFNQDRPLAKGSPWLDFYGVRGHADRLRRVTVDGSDRGLSDWLKVTVQPRGEVLTFEKVPLG